VGVIPATAGSIKWADRGEKASPISKIPRVKKGWVCGMSSRAPAKQAEAQSSNPSSAKKKKFQGHFPCALSHWAGLCHWDAVEKLPIKHHIFSL
jgi:hypothetical protein